MINPTLSHSTNLQTLAPDEIHQTLRARFLESLGLRRLGDSEKRLDEWQAWLAGLPDGESNIYAQDYRYCQAILHFERHEFDQAEQKLRTLLTEALSPLQKARVCMEMGILLSEQSQFYEAETFLRQAQSAFADIKRVVGQAKAYNNLGTAITYQVEQGTSSIARLNEAIECHRTALQLLANEPPTPEAQSEQAHNWHGLGMAWGLQKQYPEAQYALQMHIDICKAIDDNAELAIGLSDLATLVLQPSGQVEAATQALNEAILLLEQHQDALHLAEALTRRGHLLAAAGQWSAALRDYEAAITTVETVRARLTTPIVQAGYRATTEFIYRAPLSLYLHQYDARQALTAAERMRGRALVDLLAGQRPQSHADIPAELLLRRQQLQHLLDQIYHLPSSAETIAFHETELEQELDQVDRQIELCDPAYMALQRIEALSAAQICNRLPKDAVLLMYVGDAHDQLWALIATPDDVTSTLIPKLSYRWLQAYLSDHQKTEGKKVQRPGQLVLLPQRDSGSLLKPTLYPTLYSLLIQPIYPQIAQARTLYIIPTDRLHYVPIGALTPEIYGVPPLLADKRRVVYAPSATVLLTYCHQRPPSPHKSILTVAPTDPELRLNIGAAHQIAQAKQGRALVGTEARREVLLAQANDHQIVCFFGHATFNGTRPMLSYLKVTDGVLQASEILRNLRLNADLVVLAACESGRSQILRGDEILGLSRALFYAGAPSLLVTLWKVHELPTRLLLEKFFSELNKNSTSTQQFDPALVLAIAQNWLRELTYQAAYTLLATWNELSTLEIERLLHNLWQVTHPGRQPQAEDTLFAHPFFWSPFILIGDQQRNGSKI